MRARAREVATPTLAQFKELKNLEQSLKEALSSKQILEGKASSLKVEVVATFSQYFERAIRQMTFFYLNMDLIQMTINSPYFGLLVILLFYNI